MILALDAASELAFFVFTEQCPAMATNVMESANRSLLITRNNDTGIGEAADKVVARIRNLRSATGAQLHIKVDGLHLTLKPGRIGVIALWQRGGFRDCELGTGV